MSFLFSSKGTTSASASPAKQGDSRTGSITTNDGVNIVYEKYGAAGSPVVVLVHGWSGSRHYFDLNCWPLAKGCQVVTYDQRFHGDSGRPTWGYHVSRLAADLRELLTQLELAEVTVVGTSMGCAVIWAYIELFGEDRLARAVFVDQAPLQNIVDGWRLGSNGCYDIASLTRLQCNLLQDFPGFAKGNGECCVALPLSAEVGAVLEKETLRADPDALARLMADHTQLDWRPLLPRITIPCLNVAGRKSQIFPWEGVEVVGKLIPNCHTVFFEQCGHWLYLEEADKFNQLVLDFVSKGFYGVGTKVRV